MIYMGAFLLVAGVAVYDHFRFKRTMEQISARYNTEAWARLDALHGNHKGAI